jgi:hypothetical protein
MTRSGFDTQAVRLSRRRPMHPLARFSRAEDGGLLVFGLFMVVPMLIAAGIAVDKIRFEYERTRLQNTADSAVLAAASLAQVTKLAAGETMLLVETEMDYTPPLEYVGVTSMRLEHFIQMRRRFAPQVLFFDSDNPDSGGSTPCEQGVVDCGW